MTRQPISTISQPPLHYLTRSVRRASGFVLARHLEVSANRVSAVPSSLRHRTKQHFASRLTDRDTLLLADFGNRTGEPVFDNTLKQALAVQLQQSPFLSLVPDEQSRETLRFMGRSPVSVWSVRSPGRFVNARVGQPEVIIGRIDWRFCARRMSENRTSIVAVIL